MADEEIEDRKLPKRPTVAIPGSKQKVEVMRRRYARGDHIHHPDDAKLAAIAGINEAKFLASVAEQERIRRERYGD